MKILAIDDHEIALAQLTGAISEAIPAAEIFPFRKPSELISFARENPCDVAFLDIQMWGMNGLAAAKILKDYNPKINIIFVTAYPEYAQDAYSLYPSGYVMKPATKEAVVREIENLRFPVDKKTASRVYVQTFGNFDVFVYGKPVKFCRSKAKEALAYLIDKAGSSVKTSELAACLWEDKENNRSLRSQTQTVICTMLQTLVKNGIGDIIIKSWNQISVDVSKINCDYYDLLNFDTAAVNAYSGEYMSNYSWAEMTAAVLSEKAGIIGGNTKFI